MNTFHSYLIFGGIVCCIASLVFYDISLLIAGILCFLIATYVRNLNKAKTTKFRAENKLLRYKKIFKDNED